MNKQETSSDYSRNSQPPIYRFKEVNFDNMLLTDLQKEKVMMPCAYINYNDTKRNLKTRLLVQTDKIKLTYHGIPPLDEEMRKRNPQMSTMQEYIPDDSKREFIKIPLDPEQPACMNLRKHLEKADKWAGSNETKRKIFGKESDHYQYQPCIKCPESDDDKKKMEYVKMKFNIEINENKERTNITILKRIEDGKKVKVKADTITEIANEIRYRSEIKLLFNYSRIWAQKTRVGGAPKKMYGLAFKIILIEYTPSVTTGFGGIDLDLLSEEEEENNNDSESSQEEQQEIEDKNDIEENEDSEEEEEEEEIPAKPPKDQSPKKKSKNKSKKNKNAEDSEEEEEQPKSKKSSKHKSKKK